MQLDLTDMVNRAVASTGISVKIPGPITVEITRVPVTVWRRGVITM